MAFLLLVMVLRVRMLMERSTGLSKTGMKTFYTYIFVFSDQTLVLLQNDKTRFKASVSKINPLFFF